MTYWLLEYWNGTPGYSDTFVVRRIFKTANEALAWAEKNVPGKFHLRIMKI